MKKIFILDTNVLLHDPKAIFAFDDNQVVIPIYVIEEIDGFKKDLSELGRNARHTARALDDLRTLGDLSRGVPTPAGGTLRVAITPRTLPAEFFTSQQTDNKILATALHLHEECQKHGQNTAIFVTKDVNLRIRADALGLTVADYDAERTDISELYAGIAELSVSAEAIASFHRAGRMPLADAGYAPNQYAALVDMLDPSQVALGKIDSELHQVAPLARLKGGMWGIAPRNNEQHFAADMLMNDAIKLVTLVGKAGTGKTLLAIAAGLQKVTEEQSYQRLLISRPIFPLGRDIGYLPGDLEEKMNPWMQPIFDNVEYLMGLNRAERKGVRSYRELMDLGIIEIEPLTYIRGRSIPNQFLIVDEAQNLTPHEVKTIISRAGENTKIVLTGDPYQIDNPYVDATNNGLVHAVNRFRQQKLAAHVSLVKGERSALAELAANVL